MIEVQPFYKTLKKNGIDFFCGVPDSLSRSFIKYIEDNLDPDHNVVSPNEGNAIALAAGYHLATGKMAGIYMQNSGLGNAMNPLVSLADKSVYGIPMLLIIGWRGEPGVKDEPQHMRQGEISTNFLDMLSVPYEILSGDLSQKQVDLTTSRLIKKSKRDKTPCAILLRKNTFKSYGGKSPKTYWKGVSLVREDVLNDILDSLTGDEIIVSTTGKTSRELYEIRNKRGESHEKDFLTVGSMGHASQIALGIAMEKKNTQVYCLDGDGSLLMHMGSLATVGSQGLSNFKHIILNNAAHESVGGQPTNADKIKIYEVAKNCGYKFTTFVDNKEELLKVLKKLKKEKGPALVSVRINLQSRKDLGRPLEKPSENKKLFMNYVKNGKRSKKR